ncbi:MAG: hypothetical protein LBP87_05620, partial [Planctomycetaceae bacterium]|nr:hypothetical protein [Planctomycetaceae bacterium]
EDDEPKPKKKTVTKNDDEDDEPFSPVKPKSKVPFDTDEDDEPKFKKKAVLKDDDEDDDEPPAKSKPKSKHSVVEDWEDED